MIHLIGIWLVIGISFLIGFILGHIKGINIGYENALIDIEKENVK